jgi:hypothetical protein
MTMFLLTIPNTGWLVLEVDVAAPGSLLTLAANLLLRTCIRICARAAVGGRGDSALPNPFAASLRQPQHPAGYTAFGFVYARCRGCIVLPLLTILHQPCQLLLMPLVALRTLVGS